MEKAFQFGAEGLVVPVVQKRPVSDAVDVFDEMEAGTIQGRMVLDFTHHALKSISITTFTKLLETNDGRA